MTTQTETKKKALKSAVEKNSHAVKGFTETTPEQMLKIHNADPHQFKWIQYHELKERYAMIGQSISLLAQRYNIPCIGMSTHKPLMYSVPCVEWVLALPELHQSNNEDTVLKRLAELKAEAEAEAKAEFKKAYLEKLEKVSV